MTTRVQLSPIQFHFPSDRHFGIAEACGLCAVVAVLLSLISDQTVLDLALAPSAALMMAAGFTTIRAGLFSLAFFAVLLNFIELDRRGKRAWIVYNDGSYVMWNLWPGVLFGLDSRNDVGYSYAFISEILAFYKAKPGWHETLDRYPTDMVLIKRTYPLANLMASDTNWNRVYWDDAFELWARPGLALPAADRSGQPIVASFP